MKRPTALRDKFMVLLLLDTAMRITEVARLNIKDLDLNSGEVSVPAYGSGQKTKARKLYLGVNAKKAAWRASFTLAESKKRAIEPGPFIPARLPRLLPAGQTVPGSVRRASPEQPPGSSRGQNTASHLPL